MFIGLVDYTDGWESRPYLVESWEVSKDGMASTFHLVKDALCHGGAPVTSEDVAFFDQCGERESSVQQADVANVT